MPAAPMTPDTLLLRDIHLPPAVSWWPPAPGWWGLLVLLLLLGWGGYWLLLRHRRRNYRRLALQQLQAIAVQYQQNTDSQQLLKSLSRLLRQAAQLHYSDMASAGLVGENWLNFLDRQLGGTDFSQGCGQVLALGPYQPDVEDVDGAALLSLSRRWLRGLPLAAKPVRRQK